MNTSMNGALSKARRELFRGSMAIFLAGSLAFASTGCSSTAPQDTPSSEHKEVIPVIVWVALVLATATAVTTAIIVLPNAINQNTCIRLANEAHARATAALDRMGANCQAGGGSWEFGILQNSENNARGDSTMTTSSGKTRAVSVNACSVAMYANCARPMEAGVAEAGTRLALDSLSPGSPGDTSGDIAVGETFTFAGYIDQDGNDCTPGSTPSPSPGAPKTMGIAPSPSTCAYDSATGNWSGAVSGLSSGEVVAPL